MKTDTSDRRREERYWRIAKVAFVVSAAGYTVSLLAYLYGAIFG